MLMMRWCCHLIIMCFAVTLWLRVLFISISAPNVSGSNGWFILFALIILIMINYFRYLSFDYSALLVVGLFSNWAGLATTTNFDIWTYDFAAFLCVFQLQCAFMVELCWNAALGVVVTASNEICYFCLFCTFNYCSVNPLIFYLDYQENGAIFEYPM